MKKRGAGEGKCVGVWGKLKRGVGSVKKRGKGVGKCVGVCVWGGGSEKRFREVCWDVGENEKRRVWCEKMWKR